MPKVHRMDDGEPDYKPGHQRREQLKRRGERLDLEVARRNEDTEGGMLKLKDIPPDLDILSRMSSFDVSAKRKAYEYKWARHVRPPGGGMSLLDQALSMRFTWAGTVYHVWDVVRSDMPEATELKDEAGFRRLGDCTLIRARKDLYALWERYEQRKAAEMAGKGEGPFRSYSKSKGIQIVESLDDPRVQAALREHAGRAVMEQLGNRLRTAGPELAAAMGG